MENRLNLNERFNAPSSVADDGWSSMGGAISPQNYGVAIEKLWPYAVAKEGSPAAALVLLAAHDTTRWGLMLDDLAGLEPCLLRAALVVIQGRLVLDVDPQSLINNGPARFKQLSELWGYLSLTG